jgi:hypothetical protein
LPHKHKHIQQPSPDLDDLLDWVDKKVGDEDMEEGLSAIELGIFTEKGWTPKQQDEIHKRVEVHKVAHKTTDKLGRTYFREIKTGKFYKAK